MSTVSPGGVSDHAPAIRAIQTHYAGCYFRSRLEARWAVFFDRVGLSWEHEPEGFETDAGRYLPDFRLQLETPADGFLERDSVIVEPVWFEVKPLDAPRDRRHAALADGTGIPVVVARGLPRSYDDQRVRKGASGQLERYDPGALAPVTVAFGADVSARQIDAAYTAARSARFGR